MTKTFTGGMLALIMASVLVSQATAENRFALVMKKQYRLRSVSCNSCHPKEQEENTRDVLTPFGKDVAKIVEGLMLSDQVAEVEDATVEKKKEVYEKVDKQFQEALKKFNEMKAPSGKTYAEAIAAGEVEGLVIRK
jgi:hypothetical protein